MKTLPSSIQPSAAAQPKYVTAMIGPTIGPAPEILVKWWPKIHEIVWFMEIFW